MISWLVCWLLGWLTYLEVEWLSWLEWLSGQAVEWLSDWVGLSGLVSDWSCEWLIDRVIDSLTYYLFRNNTSGEEITGKSWYYGAISRGECDILMSERGQDGDFIVRDSESTVSWQQALIYIFCRYLDEFDSFSIYRAEITCYEGYSMYPCIWKCPHWILRLSVQD